MNNNKLWKELLDSTGEHNFRGKFNKIFCNGTGDTEYKSIDFVIENATFESKFKTTDTIPEMIAQLIATHKIKNEPFRKYVGCFNESLIGIMPTRKIDIDSINLDWESITPSSLTKEQLQVIVSKIDLNDIIIKWHASEFNDIKDLLGKIQRNEDVVQTKISESFIQNYAVELNDLIHKFGILEAERPLFFSSVLLTLTDKAFYASYKLKESNDIIDDVVKIATREITNISKQNPKANNKSTHWEALLKSIVLHFVGKDKEEIVKVIDKIKELYDKTDGLKINIDVLGKCYSIFLTYGKKEQKGDITLTPEHIKFLMCKLVDVKYDDIVLDTCTGSGGFLIKAMHMMKQDLQSRKSILNVDMSCEIEKINQERLLGIEKEYKMFALACTNLKLNGDGRSNLICGNGLEDNISSTYFDGAKATVGLINPPYSNGQSLKFLSVLCNQIKKEGKVAIICPNNFLDKASKSDRELFFNHNRLKAVIKCNDKLFMNNASTSIFVFEAGCSHKLDSDDVYYYNFEDDGYDIVIRNGRMQIMDTDTIVNNLLRDFQGNTVLSSGSYKKKINSGYIGYINPQNVTPSPNTVTEPALFQEDFEEAIFDYYLFEHGLNQKIKEISHHDVKMFILRELKNDK